MRAVILTSLDSELYLSSHEARRERVAAARALLGSFDEDTANVLRESIATSRESWR